MPKRLVQLGEFGLIDYIRRQLSVPDDNIVCNIGDDTAIVRAGKDKRLLLTTDMLIEGVHFTVDTDYKLVGQKSVNCSISDIAAMGGVPKYVLLSLGINGNLCVEKIKRLISGIKIAAGKFGCAVVGGDIVKSDKLVINVALTGEVEKNSYVLRSGAKKGDIIFVTGHLGGSFETGAHLSFTPRVNEARYLVSNYNLGAMIDVSDGLSSDLGHILEQSKVGAVLHEDKVPVRKGFDINNALCDGEDFELLFTVSQNEAVKLQKNIESKKTGFKFVHIGEIVGIEKGFTIEGKNGGIRKIDKKGFRHF